MEEKCLYVSHVVANVESASADYQRVFGTPLQMLPDNGGSVAMGVVRFPGLDMVVLQPKDMESIEGRYLREYGPHLFNLGCLVAKETFERVKEALNRHGFQYLVQQDRRLITVQRNCAGIALELYTQRPEWLDTMAPGPSLEWWRGESPLSLMPGNVFTFSVAPDRFEEVEVMCETELRLPILRRGGPTPINLKSTYVDFWGAEVELNTYVKRPSPGADFQNRFGPCFHSLQFRSHDIVKVEEHIKRVAERLDVPTVPSVVWVKARSTHGAFVRFASMSTPQINAVAR